MSNKLTIHQKIQLRAIVARLKAEGSHVFLIDLFCGAGGVSEGARRAKGVSVIYCINHDALAIKSHTANHPDCIHAVEDIRTHDLSVLMYLVKLIRKHIPGAVIALWASLECTNFSKAKGGLPRDADSRTLAEHLFRYMDDLHPDIIYIENVMEFMCWGPLDANGKPLSRKNGSDYVKWVEKVKACGYDYDYRILNAADFGAFTSRVRYFGQFAKPHIKIAWPTPTHAKKPQQDGMFGAALKPWKAVREVLQLAEHGDSIFAVKPSGQPRIKSDKTFERIYHGLVKFVAGGKEAFLLKYNSTNQNGKHNPPGIDAPCPTVATQNRLGVCNAQFISKYFSGKPEHKNQSVEAPAPTVRTKDGTAFVTADFILHYQNNCDARDTSGPLGALTTKDKHAFITTYHGNGANVHTVDRSAPTVPTKDSLALIQPKQFIARDFTGGGQHNDIDRPGGSVMPCPKMNLVTTEPFIVSSNGGLRYSSPPALEGETDNDYWERMERDYPVKPKPTDKVLLTPFLMDTQYGPGPERSKSLSQPAPTQTGNRKHYYLMNPQYLSPGKDINEPAFTLIARMDKMPPYLIVTESGHIGISVEDTDSEYMVKIKEFMALYGIVDIKMRMLFVEELLRIQGFPDGYVLYGTQADKKKFIGNAVECTIAHKKLEASAEVNKPKTAA